MPLEDFFDVHILIWTLINFALFMLVFKYLLLDPILKVMHSRQEKIDAFNKECQRIASEEEHNRSIREQEAQKRLSAAKENLDKAYNEALKDYHDRLAEIDAENDAALIKAKTRIEADNAEIRSQVDEMLPSLTAFFLNKVTGKDENHAS